VYNDIAVWMGWDWGFVWKNIGILGAKVGFKITNYNKGNGQGIGSISLIGESFQPEMGSPSNILIAMRSEILQVG
jgi:hypothetical protein